MCGVVERVTLTIIQTICSQELRPLLNAEAEHMKLPGLIYRPRDLESRDICGEGDLLSPSAGADSR